jgi:hypothetical protein
MPRIHWADLVACEVSPVKAHEFRLGHVPEFLLLGFRNAVLVHPGRDIPRGRQLLDTAAAIQDPFEQALFAMVQLPYLQPFDDVNKRVSRLSANIPFTN